MFLFKKKSHKISNLSVFPSTHNFSHLSDLGTVHLLRLSKDGQIGVYSHKNRSNAHED